MMEPKPKPCPFCKKPTVDIFLFASADRVVCLECKAEGPPHHDRDMAIQLWNRAHKEPEPPPLNTPEEVFSAVINCIHEIKTLREEMSKRGSNAKQ